MRSDGWPVPVAVASAQACGSGFTAAHASSYQRANWVMGSFSTRCSSSTVWLGTARIVPCYAGRADRRRPSPSGNAWAVNDGVLFDHAPRPVRVAACLGVAGARSGAGGRLELEHPAGRIGARPARERRHAVGRAAVATRPRHRPVVARLLQGFAHARAVGLVHLAPDVPPDQGAGGGADEDGDIPARALADLGADHAADGAAHDRANGLLVAGPVRDAEAAVSTRSAGTRIARARASRERHEKSQ